MLELYFSVEATSLPGETVRIVGSSKELGSWDPKQGLNLSYSNEVWEGRIMNVRHGKCVIT